MHKNSFLILLTASAISSCSLAPDMPNELPSFSNSFKEEQPLQENDKWKKAEPSEEKDRGQWWKIFDDEKLNELENQAIEANNNLKAAAARVKQARASADVRSAQQWPDISIGADVFRQDPANIDENLKPSTLYRTRATLNYEADLLGGSTEEVLAKRFESQSQEAAYKSVLLILQADVASTYYTLRALDEEIRTLNEAIKIRETAEQIMKKRKDAGYTNNIDYARAQADLATARADLFATTKQRKSLEHSLAVLLGKAPVDFSLDSSPLSEKSMPPTIPAGLPSELLERRPDVAAAQRLMEAANKRIGVARSAFFPRISMTIFGGTESEDFSNLFEWSSRSWALGPLFGPSISLPIFNAGKNFANLELTKAKYEESAATYRQQVLVAFADVETSLSDIRALAKQEAEQKISYESAKYAATLANLRYNNGDLNFLEVIDAQRSQLTAARGMAQIKGAHYRATINLISAIGGGW